MAKMGRPSNYSEAQSAAICEHIATGKSLVSFCQEEGNPGYSTVARWLSLHQEFREMYARAREAQADYLAEEIIEISNNTVIGVKTKTNEKGETETTEGDMTDHRRLQIDARKWYAAKLAPRKYGDKVETTLTGSLDHSVKVTFVDGS